MGNQVTIDGIIEAERNLAPVVKKTELQLNSNLSKRYNAQIFLKREDLQLVRSYKLRGAYNAISHLNEEQLSNGIVCASAGNHAQGVAFACQAKKIKGTIFMPSTTPNQKINQVKMFGGDYVELKITGDTFDDSYDQANTYCKENSKTFIHPFDNPKVIEGQATVGVEIFKDFVGEIDYILIAIGGGGLSAGICEYFNHVSPKTKIIGVEPAGAPSMKTSIDQGQVVELEHINKFVDGAAVKKVGETNFPICQKYLSEVLIVDEGKVCSSIIELYNKEAIVAEPAGALTVAALDQIKDEIKNKNVVCIVSGSNNDLARMEEIKERSLLYEGLKHYFVIRFPQRSGALREFLDNVLGPNDDITHFEYTKKRARESGPAIVGIELTDKNDYQGLIERMNKYKIDYKKLNEDPTLFEYFI